MRLLLSGLLLCSLLRSSECKPRSSSLTAGSLTITEDGVRQSRYIVSSSAAEISIVDQRSVILRHNNRAYVASSPADEWSPYIFQGYHLFGKTLSYTVDLSGLSCSCNGGIYLVTMPGIGEDGEPDPGSAGDYYCDANNVTGVYCWEMDIMEANRFAAQSTAHDCDCEPHHYCPRCDRIGCGTNVGRVRPDSFGPSSDLSLRKYAINTLEPLNYSVSFEEHSIRTRISQGSNNVDFEVCHRPEYRKRMKQAEQSEMVLVLTYWGDEYSRMAWLDAGDCSGDCNTSGLVTFSDISIG